mmetsp:Transcript_13817/g.15906  ORF Transcript_13817/g.15906 Transcript_13817/m.15906 type:complete len:104 (-) Transcript_13817:24-335(-)
MDQQTVSSKPEQEHGSGVLFSSSFAGQSHAFHSVWTAARTLSSCAQNVTQLTERREFASDSMKKVLMARHLIMKTKITINIVGSYIYINDYDDFYILGNYMKS